MTIQSIREFAARQYAAASAVACLVATLDAKAKGIALDPTVAERMKELIATVGGADVLDDITADDARALVPEIRQQIRFDAQLLRPEKLGSSWGFTDPDLLQDIGAFSRAHAQVITRNIVPALEGLADRLGASTASFLDIGVGVAGTSCEMASLWPSLRVVGIDVWQPSLALARENVKAAGLGSRIELREQAAETLEDDAAFDLAWMPIMFMPERILPAAMDRTRRALRPGGWVIVPFVVLDGIPPAGAALWRLRMATFGGPLLSPAAVEDLLKSQGYVDVHCLPRHPAVPAAFAVARRKAA
jgi:predicted O-methyltransferase YrrM